MGKTRKHGKSSDMVAMLMILLLLGICIGQTSASHYTDFQKCWNECMSVCSAMYPGVIAGAICPVRCAKRCLDDINSSDDHSGVRLSYYCKLGCASQNCVNISTPQDPRGEEVEKCVNSCSDECAEQF
ncbi:hypothetical protein MKX03_033111 [Papaver bracteatum]|nr:hypothetical protein MKX03_033111 [Papaver bracteatum]